MTANPRQTTKRAVAMDIQPARSRKAPLKKPVKAAAKLAAPPAVPQSTDRKNPDKRSWLKKLLQGLNQHPLKNHPFIVPVATFVALSFMSMILYVAGNGSTLGASDTRLVSLTIDGEERVIPTRADTVKELLERLDVPVTDKDIVEPSLETEIIESNFSVNVYTARPVTIIDGSTEATIVTAAPTARGVARAAGLTVYPEDKVDTQGKVVETEDVLRGRPVAEVIVIERATPATINLYGSNIPIRTHVATVADAIREKHIQTLPDDVITPHPDTPITPNTQIFITRVGKAIDSREEEIPMPREEIKDPNLPIGRSTIRQQGNPGRKVVTYEVQMENDVEVSRRPIQEIIAVQPVKHIVVVGSKPPTVIVAGDHAALMLQAGIPASQHESAEYIISRESGWRLDARNSSGCLGLGQACPGSKLVNVCPEYANDAICQLRFFTNYVNGRYGSWNGAYQFWIVNHWY